MIVIPFPEERECPSRIGRTRGASQGFDADAARYEPQFGGYCGYAASIDKLSPI